MSTSRGNSFNNWLFGAYVVVSVAAIFYLPYRIPSTPSASDSYLFGYNNRAGAALLLALVTIGAIWTRGLNLNLKAPAPSDPVSRRILFITMLSTIAGCLVMYMLAGRYGGFGESSYEIDRTWLLSQGKTPYVDFEWPFGVAFLYGPLLICRFASLSIVGAYYLFWVVNCLLGLLLLYAVINLIDYPSNSKTTIYLLIFGSWFLAILGMGTHYTLVRYACPLYFVLLVQNTLKQGGMRAWLRSGCLGIVFTIFLLLISPETAIAFAWACFCIFCLLPRRWNTGTIVGLLIWTAALGSVFGVTLKLHVLDTVRASGGGADSFPIAPAPHLLVFFAAIFQCACYVYKRFASPLTFDNTIGLIAYSLPMIAAALGRCDTGHVLLNGLGIFLASMFYVSNRATVWRWYKATFIVVFVALPSTSAILDYQQPIRRCGLNLISESGANSWTRKSLLFLGRKYVTYFASPAKKAKWEQELDSFQRLSVPMTVNLSTIYPTWHGAFLAPFGYKPNGFGTYLSSQIDYGRFEGIENANTPSAIHEKVAEIQGQPERGLLLPDQFDRLCQFDIQDEKKRLSTLYAFPYFGSAVHPVNLREPMCNYIHAHYHMEQAATLDNFGYGLWIAGE